MIYTHEDFIDELAELHPEVTKESLALIAKRGLQGVNRIMRSGQELLLHTGYTEANLIKFLIYMTPEDQAKHANRNYYRKLRRKERLDGEAKTTK